MVVTPPDHLTVTGARENLCDPSPRGRSASSSPEGGDDGGTVVFAGRPADLLAVDASHTGQHLARHVAVAVP